MESQNRKSTTMFDQWCIKNNFRYILELWDYELNDIKPDEIPFKTNVSYWFKCPRGIHESELKAISNITRREDCLMPCKCKKCNSFGQWLIDNYGKNAIEKHWSKKNTISPFDISRGSGTKVWLICQNCGAEKEIKPCTYAYSGFGCRKCSDGISYAEKFVGCFFDQILENHIQQYSPEWAIIKHDNKKLNGKKIYDEYLPNYEEIIEIQGVQHDRKRNRSFSNCRKARSTTEEIENDNIKRGLVEQNGYKYIEILAYESTPEYIKNSIFSIPEFRRYDLSKVDWNKCHEFALNSFVKTVCKLWDDGMTNIDNIAKATKFSKKTVRKYLKQGSNINWCSYNPREQMQKQAKIMGDINKKKYSKQIVQLTLEDDFIKYFESIWEASRVLNIGRHQISRCCRNEYRYKSAGGYHWMYYEDYLKLHKD